MTEAGLAAATPVTRIGRITERKGSSVVVRAHGLPIAVERTGFDHFSGAPDHA